MKKTTLFFAALLVITQLHAQAPDPTNTPPVRTPARRDSSPLVSPEVHPDRTVTFRLRAPNANGVKISGEGAMGEATLTNSQGVWSATIGPLEPDIYGYSMTLDGVSIVDPNNPWVKPMRAARTSVVQVPGEPPRPWEIQSVPHGTVHEHSYFSKSLSVQRRVHVYTPPGYEKDSQSYPVLYLLHGSGDNDATWSAVGRAQFIEDNLLAEHKARPMLIVMPDGHAFSGNPGQVGTNMITSNVENFGNDLLKDVMPMIEATYRVKASRDGRAIIGLSMGGGQSLGIGLRHRELFAWVGGMSSYLAEPAKLVEQAFPESKSDLKLLWFACGKDDRLIENARQLSTALKQKNINHKFEETPGSHAWPVWRRHLGEFLPPAVYRSKGRFGPVIHALA
jgi:enterochelin esterase-like enzyme